MRVANPRDAVIGGLFTLLGIAVLYFSSGLRAMPGMAVGPGLFPQLTGAGLTFFGALMAVNGIRYRAAEEAEAVADVDYTLADRLFSPILLLSLLVLVVAMPVFGFLVTATVFSVVVVRISGGGWLPALIFSTAITYATYALFLYGLRVQLPSGLWG